MAQKHRVIFHVDMNCYFASVEIAKNEELKGKPVAIAGNVNERRGIIITCSYEARAQGIRTTMPLWEGMKKCPDLIVLPPNHELYRNTSYEIFHLLGNFSPILEPVSIDEAYIDVTNALKETQMHPIDFAKLLQETLLEELKLPCSIGIAPNKFLAKMASDMKKPLGITVLRKRDVPQILWELPVEEMHGIGKKTKEKYWEINIRTIGDLAKADVETVRRHLGKVGVAMLERANGTDNRPVNPEEILSYKSIGNSTTLPENIDNEETLIEILRRLSEKVSTRLQGKKLIATVWQITIRYGNRKTITRSQTLVNPVQEADELFRNSVELFRNHWSGDTVRLLGVSALETIDEKNRFKQLDIFTYENERAGEKELLNLASKINEKFGKDALFLGKQLKGETKKSRDEYLYEALKRKREAMNDDSTE